MLYVGERWIVPVSGLRSTASLQTPSVFESKIAEDRSLAFLLNQRQHSRISKHVTFVMSFIKQERI